jgi:hypothetical protein
MSQPALEVTGSQEVGSSHSQLSVPLAPEAPATVAAAPAEAVLEPLLPHAATAEMVVRTAAAAATR